MSLLWKPFFFCIKKQPFQKKRLFERYWYWFEACSSSPTLSDMLSVILRSMQSLSPVDWASAKRSLVIAFNARLDNWGASPVAPVGQKTQGRHVWRLLSPSVSQRKLRWWLLLLAWYLPDSFSRLSFLLCFSSFLLFFFAASCLSQLRCFLNTFFCLSNRQNSI